MSGQVLLDSSAWIEILGSGPLSSLCESERKKAEVIVVPTLVIFEVYRKILKDVSEDRALLAISVINQNQVENLTQEVSLTAGDLSLEHGLAMADSIILAHAKVFGATLITLDNDFAGIPGVKVIR